MISIAPGSRPDSMIARHGVAGGLQACVRREHRAIHRRARHEAQRDLEGDAEQPLRSDEQAAEIGAACSRLSPPSVATVPSPSTASMPSTWLAVMPWRKQCAPPELKATLPPIVQTDWLDGSGA